MGQLTKQFGKIKVEVEIPHLLNLQVDSYRKFMQEGRTERLPDEGLEGVFPVSYTHLTLPTIA